MLGFYEKISLRFLTVLLFCTASILCASEKPAPIQMELISEEASIQPGRAFCVGVHLTMKEGWHTYWKNPGDAGMATRIEWDLPPGLTASSIIWPVPEKIHNDILTGYGYHGEVLLMTLITPSGSLTLDAPLTLKAKVNWLVCSDAFCQPGENNVSLQLPVSAAAPQSISQNAPLFAKARLHTPEKMNGIVALLDGELIQMRLPLSHKAADDAEEVYFFPEEQGIIDHSFEAVLDPASDSAQHSLLILKVSPEKPDDALELRGVLALMNKHGDTLQIANVYEIHSNIAAAEIGKEHISMGESAQQKTLLTDTPPAESDIGLAMALLLAFAGGMILNLMPCVLPVISFKVLSFVKMAGQNRMAIFKHSLAFVLGVLVSFWILAALLLVLQAYGHAVGWGFQLQEPLFVSLLAAFLLMFAFSLFGVYELGEGVTALAGKAHTHLSQKSSGHVSSFFSGVLATAVATPCTGPFLGTVVGMAMSVSSFDAMLLFTFMGLGMALPYMLLAVFPRSLKFLPKPGPWMDTFKQLMGFLMLATVLWLVWVFGAQTDTNALTFLLASFFLLAMACWIYGRWGSSVKSLRSRLGSISAAVLLIAASGYLIVNASHHHQENADAIAWEHFSPEKLSKLQHEGTPVLIDFTAKWCLTCQANRVALTADEVEQKLTELGVVTMEADWTKSDPTITQELHKYGRNSVPLYLLFTGKENDPPIIMPQMLTADIVLEHLKSVEEVE